MYTHAHTYTIHACLHASKRQSLKINRPDCSRVGDFERSGNLGRSLTAFQTEIKVHLAVQSAAEELYMYAVDFSYGEVICISHVISLF